MAWTTPRTWTTGELVTASILNAHVRDNLNMLARLDISNSFTGGTQTIAPTTTTNFALLSFSNADSTDNYIGTDNSTGSGLGSGAYGMTMYGAAAAGISIRANHASGSINLKVNGNTTRFAINASGDWLKGSSILDSVGTPSVTSGFGSGASVTKGLDYGFIVNTGSTSSTGGVVTFGRTYTSAPVCQATWSAYAAGGVDSVATTTTVTFAYGAATSANIYVHCRGGF